MATSRRTEIIDFLVTQLKEIDKAESGFDSSYTYNTNLFNNVFRKIKFIDEVNDFPALYLSAGTENRDFNTKSLTVATLDVTIRAYVVGEDDAQRKVDDLVKDISIVLQDHDEAIMYYFNNVIRPSVIINGNRTNVPIIYGSPESWKGVQKDGFYRDKELQIKLSQRSYELCSRLSGKNKFSKNWKVIEEILYE